MFYLIKRGSRPDYHKAPFHPYIICDNRRVATREVGPSSGQAWLWSCCGEYEGWLLERWQGLDIDYGNVVYGFDLPDGSHAAFWRSSRDWPDGVRDLIAQAIWWSNKRIPAWLLAEGVKYSPDYFTQQRIQDIIANDNLMGGNRRLIPDHWPQAE